MASRELTVELDVMRLARTHRWLAGGVAAAVSVTGVLAATSSSQSRDSVLRGLERPAQPAAATTAPTSAVSLVRGRARVRLGSEVVVVRLTPNRAGAHNRLSATLTSRGKPLVGAALTVTFGMRAMNMPAAFSTRLVGEGAGRYGVEVPVLGMPGVWQLRVHVAAPDGRPLGGFAVADLLAQ